MFFEHFDQIKKKSETKGMMTLSLSISIKKERKKEDEDEKKRMTFIENLF